MAKKSGVDHGQDSVFALVDLRRLVALPLVIERSEHDAEVLGRLTEGVGVAREGLEDRLHLGVLVGGTLD